MVPLDALNIALVLALAFFVGLEREEHKQREAPYAFGGVRTFPLIGLVSYALALISTATLAPWAIGFTVVGGFMLLSYHRKLPAEPPAGMTTEISALATYVLGGLVQREHYWIATTLGVLSRAPPRAEEGARGSDQATSPRTRLSRSRSSSSCWSSSCRSCPIGSSPASTSTRSRPGSSWWR